MRNIFYLFLMTVFSVAFVSCSDEFLDETVTSDLNRDLVFSDSAYTEGFLTAIYNGVGFDTNWTRFTGGLQTASDEAEYHRASEIKTDAQFATGTVNPITVTDDAWKTCYNRIRRANVFLKETGERDPVFQEGRLRNYRGEARFLRAWYYHLLLRHYGGVPIVEDDIYESEDDPMKTARSTYEETVNYIVSECEKAFNELTVYAPVSNKDYGRAGKGACLALIARVRLYAASKLFNGSDFGKDQDACPKELVGYPEYDHERWRLAKEAAQNVFLVPAYYGEPYTLYGLNAGVDPDENDAIPQNKNENYNTHAQQVEPGFGYYALFVHAHYTTDDRKPFRGTIFERMAGNGISKTTPFWPPGLGGERGGGHPYADLADAFPTKSGRPISESPDDYDPSNPYENRDPRFLHTIVPDRGRVFYQNETAAPRIVNIALEADGTSTSEDAVRVGTPTGYYFRKMSHWEARPQTIHWFSDAYPLIRIAEIWMALAEASNEYDIADGAPASETAYEALRLIRKRAGILPGDDGNYGLKSNMTKEEMRKAIQDEKRIEFAMEGHRFWDVRRWMIAEETDNREMRGVEPRKVAGNPDARTYSSFTMGWKHVFRKAMYLWPIPYNEVAKSEEMIQNPYY